MSNEHEQPKVRQHPLEVRPKGDAASGKALTVRVKIETVDPGGTISIPLKRVTSREWEERQNEERCGAAFAELRRWLAAHEADRMQGRFIYLEPVFEAIKLVLGEEDKPHAEKPHEE